MGCQTDIAEKIVAQKADYILAVKNNQPQLYEDVKDEFRFGKNIPTWQDHEFGHGRIETRTCSVITDWSC